PERAPVAESQEVSRRPPPRILRADNRPTPFPFVLPSAPPGIPGYSAVVAHILLHDPRENKTLFSKILLPLPVSGNLPDHSCLLLCQGRGSISGRIPRGSTRGRTGSPGQSIPGLSPGTPN